MKWQTLAFSFMLLFGSGSAKAFLEQDEDNQNRLEWTYAIWEYSAATGRIEQLERVVITGTRCADNPYCRANLEQIKELARRSGDTHAQQIAEMLGQATSDLIELIMGELDLKDVRTLCRIPGREELAQTVSTSSPETRADAARALIGAYQARWALRAALRGLRGGLVPAPNGSGLVMPVEITYADGGTQVYFVNPVGTINATPAGPVVGGTGVPANVPC